ncbi:Tagatose-6-phosphate kinase [Symmachiella macrocystis]|uniref:Tagatose-6-phosphate kinase n=1 Tax=Symmachiella macrocystis TaxID=2527985 RepID=A0A5C6BVU1_9PLAN|nr:hexose kinase [Symmachiella macrocystis]TWU14789.1 Tagatose-6-phosphate kinase [Symmachiella macrocystis]
MIIAAGLTPAWQQIVLLDRLQHGEVNRAREVHWCASGKVLNVGIALHHLGAEAETISLVGGLPAHSIDVEFEKFGIARKWISTESATRVCTTLLEAETGIATELVENAAAVTAGELADFHSAFCESSTAADVILLAGSLPAGTPETYYRDLMTGLDARVIIDGRGAELAAALEAAPFLVKPNREELARTVGRELTSDDDLVAAMRELNAAGAQWVLVTQGAHAVWLTSATECLQFQPPAITPVNPIGSGDSLAAGIGWGLANGEEITRAVQLGIAAGVENALQLLPGRVEADTVIERAGTITVESYG